MEVILPIAVGAGVALITAAAFIALRSRVEPWREERLHRLSQVVRKPAALVTHATSSNRTEPRRAPVLVMDENMMAAPVAPRRARRPTTPGKRTTTPGKRTTAGRRPASPTRTATRAKPEMTALDASSAGEDVLAHTGAFTDEALEPNAEPDLDLQPVMNAQNIYWQTNGSTDCAACPSSRLRGARFCIRCGRRLV